MPLSSAWQTLHTSARPALPARTPLAYLVQLGQQGVGQAQCLLWPRIRHGILVNQHLDSHRRLVPARQVHLQGCTAARRVGQLSLRLAGWRRQMLALCWQCVLSSACSMQPHPTERAFANWLPNLEFIERQLPGLGINAAGGAVLQGLLSGHPRQRPLQQTGGQAGRQAGGVE